MIDEATGRMACAVMGAISEYDGDTYGVNICMALDALSSIVGLLLSPLPDDDREDLFAQFIVGLRDEMERAVSARQEYPDGAPEQVSVQ